MTFFIFVAEKNVVMLIMLFLIEDNVISLCDRLAEGLLACFF